MNITMLGTGNALTTECYNTCFVLSDNGQNFLVDTGGGNGILHQLKHAGFSLTDIHDVFISHTHIDHILGAVWLIRISAQRMNKGLFPGDVNIYGHDEVTTLVDELARRLLLPYQYDFVGRRIHLHTVSSSEIRSIIGHEVMFWDINSPRTKQFGFTMDYGGGRLAFCGDEPCKPECECYVAGCEWMMHEAFCLHSEAGRFSPYEKNHSTVKDACMTAQRFGVKNLILYHTEDSDLARRKERYTAEGSQYYSGNIFVPDDLETITI
ncbi:MAG: MBL fold metallo-hydrolase [Synergistaceae bacterium]|nr:MBL fold metallo-hydrolase [Synergistaceae bacterium]